MSGPRYVLVTGTDTGVGKTVVAAGLGRALARAGKSVVAVKPVESGCGGDGAGEDGVLLAAATGQEAPGEALVRLRRPVAPPVAADEEGVALDHSEWLASIRRLAAGAEIALVEGAGGLLSPLTWEASARDLARDLGARAVVVAADRLGSLNHTLLTLDALEAAGVDVAAVVFSTPEVPDDSTGQNAATLRRRGPGARIAVLGRVHGVDEAADALQEVASWLSTWEEWLSADQRALEAAGLVRRLRTVSEFDGLHGEIEGRRVTLFCTNDYLGLGSHPEVCAAAARAAEGGAGPRGSPLVCGFTDEHEGLSVELADLVGCEAALLTATGYAANLSVLTALADRDTEFFSDELNHASLIDGCRLARGRGAVVTVYRHADADHLESLLAASPAARKLIVTDSVFSMDGDLAPLADLVALKERHGALLVVDEAHALLVLGARGGGAAEALGVEDGVDLRVGTLGKGLGSLGGFVAGSREWITHLVNRARPYIYSTAPTVPTVVAARAALAVYSADPGLRARLDEHRKAVARVLGETAPAAIAKLVLGEERVALDAAERLLARGFFVPAMRPPTVPAGTSRLRITLSAGHRRSEVAALCEALRALGWAASDG